MIFHLSGFLFFEGGRPIGAETIDLHQFLGLLGYRLQELHAVPLHYKTCRIPKEKNRWRELKIPNPSLKTLQRTLLRRVLYRLLPCHPQALGFRRGISVVDSAKIHVGKAVVLRFDIKDFFAQTSSVRIANYLRTNRKWSPEVTQWIVRLCTLKGRLPQGAPTSPCLSNVVNSEMDARLWGLGKSLGGVYSRYADDMTFSFDQYDQEDIHWVKDSVRDIIGCYGYGLQSKKTRVLPSHRQQKVLGLVVNEKLALPRSIRRNLRAAQHHLSLGRSLTNVAQNHDQQKPTPISEAQLKGWIAYAKLVNKADGEKQ